VSRVSRFPERVFGSAASGWGDEKLPRLLANSKEPRKMKPPGHLLWSRYHSEAIIDDNEHL